MKLLFLTNIPSPYRVDFFSELGKSCDLTVTFEKRASDERDESWKRFSFDGFRGVILKGVSTAVDSAFCPGIGKFVRDRSFDEVIVSNLASPTTLLAVLIMRMRRRRYYIEADGAFVRSENYIKRALKKYAVKGAKGFFSTSKECDRYFMKYGADENAIFRYPFSSLKESDMTAPHPDKKEARKLLGIKEETVVLNVGRYSRVKGSDVLLKAAALSDRGIGFYIVGGEPPEEFVKAKENNGLNDLHFIEFKRGRELDAYYSAADIFVFPTRGDVWGLVVNEAMAHGVPVISTDMSNAARELITPGENGMIVPSEDPEAMAKAIALLASDPEKRAAFGKKAYDAAKGHTIEAMCRAHLEVLSGGAPDKEQ